MVYAAHASTTAEASLIVVKKLCKRRDMRCRVRLHVWGLVVAEDKLLDATNT